MSRDEQTCHTRTVYDFDISWSLDINKQAASRANRRFSRGVGPIQYYEARKETRRHEWHAVTELDRWLHYGPVLYVRGACMSQIA